MSDEIVKRPEDSLSVSEQEELHRWRRGKETAPLALSTAFRMYQLFLLGHSCEEIARSNEGRFPLGMILDSRLRHEWDKRRAEYLDKLYSEAGEMLRQRQVESAAFLGDMLAAAHAEIQPQLQKFIQTRDVNDLPNTFRADSITKYKMIVDALMKVTGQDRKEGGAAVQVIGNNVTVGEKSQKAPLSGSDALALLRAFDTMDKKDK
jgi:hypothetical protein